MTNGTSQGLFIVVAIVIFGIFVGLSQTLFGDELSVSLVDLFGQTTEQASNKLEGSVIDENNNGELDTKDSVVIKDDKLKTEIVNQLETLGEVVDSEKITVGNMQKLETLTATNKGIENLDGIETASNLKSLDLRGNSIKTIEPLTKLKNLVYLNVQGNQIIDFEVLNNMNIETLHNIEYTDGSLFTYVENDSGITITKYLGTDVNVVIPKEIENKPVTEIGDYAFYKGTYTDYKPIKVSLENVIIPFSVRKIGVNTFSYNKLTEVTFPNSVESIGAYAFWQNKLTKVTIPSSVMLIEDYSFGFNALTEVTIPDSVTTIGNYAFKSNQLLAVTLPKSLIKVGNNAFDTNNLTEVTIPDSVTTIGNYAFAYNHLTKVIFPDSLLRINNYAFKYNKLTSIEIHKNTYYSTSFSFDSGVVVKKRN